MKRKRIEISIQVKKYICKLATSSVTYTQNDIKAIILNEYNLNIGRSTICEIIKEKEKWFAIDDQCDQKTRIKKGEFPQIEDFMVIWISQMNCKGVIITGEEIRIKALEVSQKLEIANFNASDGWLEKFKKRNGIKKVKLFGEAGSISQEAVERGRIKMLELLNGIHPDTIFNFDETALFYMLMPNYTFSKTNLSGLKDFKQRLTVGLCANLSGTIKLKPFVLGHSKKPRCFRDFEYQNYVEYMANKKAWMTALTFLEFLEYFNEEMQRRNIKAKLLIDNAPSHKTTKTYSHVELIFLPENTTAFLQPMDAGIIRAFKAHYKKLLVSKFIDLAEKDEKRIVDVKQAIIFISYAWQNITEETIRNCSRKTGIIPNEAINEANITKDDDIDELGELLKIYGSELNAEQFMNFEVGIETEKIMNDEEIIEVVMNDYISTHDQVEDINFYDELLNEDKNAIEIKHGVSIDEAILGLEQYLSYITQYNCPDFAKNISVETILNANLLQLKSIKRKRKLKNTSLFDFNIKKIN